MLRFLISLGLDPETAERDAEGIEHHVSERTLASVRGFCRPKLRSDGQALSTASHVGNQAFGTDVLQPLAVKEERRGLPDAKGFDIGQS